MGIGGVGVSALARVYAARGEEVSGCDVQHSAVTDALEAVGVDIRVGHDPEHVLFCDRLVYGRATPRTGGDEIAAARAMGVEVLAHADALAALVAETRSIGVAGSAGKTTITHMIGQVLMAAGWDPSVLVGDGQNVSAGASDWLVAELDESDRSLVVHHPKTALVSNIHFDHPDHFRDLEDTIAVFAQFAAGLPADGLLVACADDAGAASLESPARKVTYGVDESAGYRLDGATVVRGGQPVLELRLRVPGRHNAVNATGAAAVALELGVPADVVARALSEFGGAHRRMERLGVWHGAELYDDYAHHPEKVRAAIAAARELPFRRLVVVFQPHRYTRYVALLDEFAASFDLADVVLVTDVYGAGEENPGHVDGSLLAGRIRQARYARDFAAVREALDGLAGRGDLVLFMGAGDIWKLGRELADG